MFTASAFALAAMFVNDWIEIERPVRILASSTPVEQPPQPETPAPKTEAPAEEPAPPNMQVQEPEPAEEPPAAAPEPPREGDPWKAEKERLKASEARRKAGWVQVNPKVLLDVDDLFNDMVRGPRMGFAMPDFPAFAAPRRIDPRAMAEEFQARTASRRVAGEIQGLIFSEVPQTRRYVSSFDVAIDDGRLVVNVRLTFLELNDEQRRVVMEGIAGVWRETKYTKRHNCSKSVEFRSGAGWRETMSP